MDRLHRFRTRYTDHLSKVRNKYDCNNIVISFYGLGDKLEKKIDLDADNFGTPILRMNMSANTEKINVKFMDDANEIVYSEINHNVNSDTDKLTFEELPPISNPSFPLAGVQNPTIQVLELQKKMELQGVHNQYTQKEFDRILSEKEKEIERLTKEGEETKGKLKKLKKKLKGKEGVEWFADITQKAAPLGKIVGALFPADNRVGIALSGLGGSAEPIKTETKSSENAHIVAIQQALADLEASGKTKEIEDLYTLINNYFAQ